MQCPVDNTRLTISDRQGVELDYCPTCRGVWLDRGELDKLITRDAEQAPHRDEREDNRDERRSDDNDEEYRGGNDRQGDNRNKKEGFLGDLFNF